MVMMFSEFEDCRERRTPSPVATAVAVVVVATRAHAAAIAATAQVDAERTVDGADGTADRATDDAPDGTADAVALRRAAPHAARQALGIGC
jgi:hypothetical protein